MKGDFFRYQAENASGSFRTKAIKDAENSYENAYMLSKSCLSPTHPMRLGLALNFSVFYYEIAKDVRKGFLLAQDAFDEGMTDLDDVQAENYKDANLNLKLLLDNMRLWQEEFDKTRE